MQQFKERVKLLDLVPLVRTANDVIEVLTTSLRIYLRILTWCSHQRNNNDRDIILLILVIVLTKSAPASILSYLLHEEEREIFAKIYLV